MEKACQSLEPCLELSLPAAHKGLNDNQSESRTSHLVPGLLINSAGNEVALRPDSSK